MLLLRPLGRFAKYRHPRYYPSEYPYLGKNDGKGDYDLHPGRKISFTQRYPPFICNDGNIKPIDDDSDHGEDGGCSNQQKVSVSRTLEKHDAGDNYQSYDLGEIPVTHGGV
jgi:hypothetical protein